MRAVVSIFRTTPYKISKYLVNVLQPMTIKTQKEL